MPGEDWRELELAPLPAWVSRDEIRNTLSGRVTWLGHMGVGWPMHCLACSVESGPQSRVVDAIQVGSEWYPTRIIWRGLIVNAAIVAAFIVVSVMKEDAPILVPKLNAKPKGKLAETKLWVHVPGTNEFKESVLTVR